MKQSIKLVSVLAALALGATACANNNSAPSGSASSADAKGPLKVGVIVPLSGPAGPNGQDVLAAIQVQAGLINDAGGCGGRKIEVLSRDDQSTPATGVSVANDLVAEKVDVVMGGWNSPVTLAIQPVLVRAGVLNITSIPQNSAILGGADPAAVRMNAGNLVGAHVAAKFIAGELGAKKVALLVQNDAYGNDAAAGMRAELQPRGIEVVTEQKFAFTDTDFRIPLSNIAAAGADVVFSANAAESSGMPAMARQLAESTITAKHFAGTGTVSPKVVQLAGGKVIDGLYTADLYFPQQAPFDTFDKNVAFVKAYGAQHEGQLPDKFRALGAQSIEVWCQAVKNAGSVERQAVANAIQGQSFQDTVLGPVSFTKNGQQKFKLYALEVVDGQLVGEKEISVDDKVWG